MRLVNTTAFAETTAYIGQFLSSDKSYTLDRMRTLMRALENPQDKLRIIHIGGTAGKGSTAYIAATILEKAGYKVGLHTTPHLVSVCERMMINRVSISERAFVELI